METIKVSSKKDRTFNFMDSNDENLKKACFKGFLYNLKRLAKKILYRMGGIRLKPQKNTINRITYRRADSTDKKAKIQKFNLLVKEIEDRELYLRGLINTKYIEIKNAHKKAQSLLSVLSHTYKKIKSIHKSAITLFDSYMMHALDKDISFESFSKWIDEDVNQLKKVLFNTTKLNLGLLEGMYEETEYAELTRRNYINMLESREKMAY